MIATVLTFSFFSFSFWRTYINKYHSKEDLIIVIILIFVVIMRIAYLLFRIFDVHQDEIVD